MPATPSLYSALLFHASRFAGEEPWLFRSEGLDWRWVSWGDLARRAAAWAGHLASRPPAFRVAFPYRPSPESIALDLGIQGAGLISVPVSGEGESVSEPSLPDVTGVTFASERPHPRPSSPRPSSPDPLDPLTGRKGRTASKDEGEKQDRPSRVPLSWGGGWGGREKGMGEGLGREDAGGVVVQIAGSPVELGAAELMAAAERVQAEIAPARWAEAREIVVLGGALETPEERAMLTWATVTRAAVALEPESELRLATAAWVRPTVFHGTVEEIAALRAWAEKTQRRRGLPFGRLRTLLVAGGEELGEAEAEFWRNWGVTLGRMPPLAAERHKHGI